MNSLEHALVEIRKWTEERKLKITTKPTKVIVWGEDREAVCKLIREATNEKL